MDRFLDHFTVIATLLTSILGLLLIVLRKFICARVEEWWKKGDEKKKNKERTDAIKKSFSTVRTSSKPNDVQFSVIFENNTKWPVYMAETVTFHYEKQKRPREIQIANYNLHDKGPHRTRVITSKVPVKLAVPRRDRESEIARGNLTGVDLKFDFSLKESETDYQTLSLPDDQVEKLNHDLELWFGMW